MKVEERGLVYATIRFCLKNKFVVLVSLLLVVLWGLYVMPFDFNSRGFPRSPVPVDAIPDIGENQQIVFTRWPGRSPRDVEDQVTYPLTVALLSVPGVKSIRSYSYFGYSSVYVIFKEDVDFYWARSRIIEKLNVAQRYLPRDAVPTLGPDATALGQIFWYTVEGKGFSLHELRTFQDWYVKPALESVEGVSEVASIGGYVKEYQVDVNPDAMRAYQVSIAQVLKAVKNSNIDVGARTVEINGVEYFIRGLGYIKRIQDLEDTVIRERNNVPIYIKNVARVTLGPAPRRGALDKEGAPVVGGVVVARYGDNPLEVIKRVKEKIGEISPGFPRKVMPDGSVSRIRVVPFYDRSNLIHQVLGTLESALTDEITITIIVVIIMMFNFTSSLLISGLLPLAVLMCFIAMKLAGVDSNIMSLSGIAIAIGTIVDMGIIMCENIFRHLQEAPPGADRLEVILRAATEVGGAVVTSISTTVFAFLPVFTMTGSEGKLFKPLAFTKTFALIASVIVAIVVLPPLIHLFFKRETGGRFKTITSVALALTGVVVGLEFSWWLGIMVVSLVVYRLASPYLSERARRRVSYLSNFVAAFLVSLLLARHWMPLGVEKGQVRNFLFVLFAIGGVLLFFKLFQSFYEPILRFFLRRKLLFYLIPLSVVLLGLMVWKGFDFTFSPVLAVGEKVGISRSIIRGTPIWSLASRSFPGLSKEFMPPFDEGSFLLMPTTMPHASIGESLDMLRKMDMAIRAIPEVESVVGKIGRVDSPLDPAPISMVETVINYKPEYGAPDPSTGRRRRLWRENIRSPDDIWREIVKATKVLGTTSAPKLQPIAARIVMLQTGMRAPMGVKIYGPTLESVEGVALSVERLLKEVPAVEPSTVVADRVIGKPYLEISIDRKAIARYGVSIRDVQDIIEYGVGGRVVTHTFEGRERYPVRVRYDRELRDNIEDLSRIPILTAHGTQVPLSQVATILYVRGPQVIKSENTFPVAYVVFDKKAGYSEVDAVEEARRFLSQKVKMGELTLPKGVSFKFTGSYEHQVKAQKTLMVVVPLSLIIIFFILYLNFRSIITSLLVFSGIVVAWAGGFILIWLYSQSWFLDFSFFHVNMRELFGVHPINLSVAIWVGFLALFGIASDDGVVMATYLKQAFSGGRVKSVEDIRERVVYAGVRRIRPCLMTVATTILALLPVLTSKGRGADIMIPMAIPSFGGMLIVLITLFVVPVTYCLIEEVRFKMGGSGDAEEGEGDP